MNPLVLVDDLGQKNGRQCFELPMVRLLAHITGEIGECLENPKKLPDPSLLPLLARAGGLGMDTILLALVQKKDCLALDLHRRGLALDLCMLWFSARLKLLLPGVPLDLFIPKDERYRI